MTAPPVKLNLKVYQGSTFTEVLRWESSTKVYKPITAITKTAPVVITATAHNCPAGWRARVTNVAGMKEINSLSDNYYLVTDTTTNTVTINSVNAVGFNEYTSGGILEYNEPVNLAGYTARMQLRAKLADTIVIKELTTQNSGIVINNTEKTITIVISASDTAAFTFSTAVYSLELISSGGEVSQMLTGTLTLVKEVTR
jgi:hypothetical protein